MATTMQAVDSLAVPSALQDVVKPQFHQVPLSAENYIKQVLRVRLDTDDQICRLALSQAGCPLGPLLCPNRHTDPSPSNFASSSGGQQGSHNRERERSSTVCKHWLRGLCKKSEQCEFMHEYNLRRLSECWNFTKYGSCPNGDECLYAHPKERKIECPDYNRGFCKLGPSCPRKHVRKVACQNYLTGFCPLGPDCTRGHPKPDIPPPSAYIPPPPPATFVLPPPSFSRYNDHSRFAGGGPTNNNTPTPSGGPYQHYNASSFNSNSNYKNGPSHAQDGAGGPGGYGGAGGGYDPSSGGGGGGMQPRRNLDEVVCFKCGEVGHYANHCRNRNVPGFRGGVERRYGGQPIPGED